MMNISEEEPEVDRIALNQESRKLLNTAIVFGAAVGLWGIWSDVLPAFGFLDQVSLWHQTQVVEGAQPLDIRIRRDDGEKPSG